MKGKPNGTYFCSCKPPVNVFGYKLFFPRGLEVSGKLGKRLLATRGGWQEELF